MKRESYIEVLINNVLREIKEQRSNHVRNKLKLPKGGLKNAGFIPPPIVFIKYINSLGFGCLQKSKFNSVTAYYMRC